MAIPMTKYMLRSRTEFEDGHWEIRLRTVDAINYGSRYLQHDEVVLEFEGWECQGISGRFDFNNSYVCREGQWVRV